MKKSTLSILFVSICFLTFSQELSGDPNVLRTEIKELEKAIKEQEKEIEKLEKSLVKVRPAAEQARRDADNISSMRDRKKSEFEAFNYDEKTKALKANEKQLKKFDKDRKSLQKSESKLDKTIQTDQAKFDADREKRDNRKGELGGIDSRRTAVDSGVMDDADQRRQKELQKEISGLDKSLNSTGKTMDKNKRAKDDAATRRAAVDKQYNDLSAIVEEQRAELKTMDKKVVIKEISDLDKAASQAAIQSDKLQKELDDTTTLINSKHDFVEAKKQEIRERESALKKL